MDNEKMGRFIAERRKSKGMTQLDLADKLHITDKAISKWERGLSSPDIGSLPQLADILGVSVGDLLKGEQTDEAAANAVSSVNEVLDYAEKTVQKKYGTIKLVLSLSFTALLLIGMIVCLQRKNRIAETHKILGMGGSMHIFSFFGYFIDNCRRMA